MNPALRTKTISSIEAQADCPTVTVTVPNSAGITNATVNVVNDDTPLVPELPPEPGTPGVPGTCIVWTLSQLELQGGPGNAFILLDGICGYSGGHGKNHWLRPISREGSMKNHAAVNGLNCDIDRGWVVLQLGGDIGHRHATAQRQR